MDWQTRRILVTVKTYPNPSRKYTETVCVAGIDLEAKRWIRLYPVPFRDLNSWQRFSKYSVIEARVSRTSKDTRPESFRVDRNSIRVVEQAWDTKRKWARRREIVLPLRAASLCALKDEQAKSATSLGLVKPENVRFYAEPVDTTSAEFRAAFYDQLDAFAGAKQAIEPIPYRFGYRFRCAGEERCRGHDLSVIDWELMQLYRTLRDRENCEQDVLRKVRQKWEGEMLRSDKDTWFYVGNVFLHPRSFLVLGVFWPPK